MAPGGDRDLQLGADAVGGGHQQGVAIAERRQVEERAEPAEAAGAAAARRRPGERLDRLDQGVAGVDVDTGLAIGLAVYGVLPEDGLYSGRGRRGGTATVWRSRSDCRRWAGRLGRAANYLIRDGLQ
jgi:hypothetical protein